MTRDQTPGEVFDIMNNILVVFVLFNPFYNTITHLLPKMNNIIGMVSSQKQMLCTCTVLKWCSPNH